ncbi:MAG: hypothetical protein J0L64_24500 [Acidobacteria bacterium]|nr:hypothetical protein [Acidobacteriota bacterium]
MLYKPGTRASGPSLASQPLASILNLHCGGAPAVLLDRHGFIVAANSKAAALLNRTVSELLGQPFGNWVSSLECADLDVVRYCDGKLTTRIVHARRLDHLTSTSHTIIAFSEKVTLANTPLDEVVHSALSRVHTAHPASREAITISRLPAVSVPAESRDVIASWILFLFHLAAQHQAHLTLRSGLRHGGWVGFDFQLTQSASLTASPICPRPTDERLLDVRRIGGDFRLLIDDPLIQLDLWIPHQIDSVPTA